MMKTMKSALFGATFLIGMGAAANAADIYGKGGSLKDGGPAYMPAITWSGFYVGLHAGSTIGGDLEIQGEGSFDVDDSFVAGIHLGYNWQKHGPWVFGIEADYSWLEDEIEDSDGIAFSEYVASIRGRLGHAYGNTLVYATGGVAFLGLDDDFSDVLEDDPIVGFVVGAGLEHKLRENVSIGVEALYYNFETEAENVNIDVERDLWTIRARLSYHINHGYGEALK